MVLLWNELFSCPSLYYWLINNTTAPPPQKRGALILFCSIMYIVPFLQSVVFNGTFTININKMWLPCLLLWKMKILSRWRSHNLFLRRRRLVLVMHFCLSGLSEKFGACVARPVNVKTFKSFFIQLELPYNAIRLEHFNVKATIFNYNTANLTVSAHTSTTEVL